MIVWEMAVPYVTWFPDEASPIAYRPQDEPPPWAAECVQVILDSTESEAECDGCGTCVGFVLQSREDTYGAEYEVTIWRTPWLCQDDDVVSVLCEDCLNEREDSSVSV